MARYSNPSDGPVQRGGQLLEELDPGQGQSTSFEGFLENLRSRRAVRELQRESGKSPCPLCKGRKWHIVDDGGAGRAALCACQKEGRPDVLEASANIPEKYRNLSIFQFDPRHQDEKFANVLQAALRLCEEYVENFFDAETKKLRTTGLLITGPPGTGKTHLAVATLREIIHQWQVFGYFVDFTTLLKNIQMTWDDPTASSLSDIMRPVLTAQVLVLDELGIQKPTDWVMQNLYWVINTRYNRGLATIFTSNFRLEETAGRVSPRQTANSLDGSGVMMPLERPATDRNELLATRISAPLLSRLYEMTQLVNLGAVGRDYRREHMAKKRQRGL